MVPSSCSRASPVSLVEGRLAGMIVGLCLTLVTVAHADYRVLHAFSGGGDDGAGPLSSTLVQSGTTLYGMTSQGGSQNKGVIFAMDLPQTRGVPDPYATIQVAPGTYYENTTLTGKELTLRSTQAGDPNGDGRPDLFVVNMAFDFLTQSPWYVARGRSAEVWLNTTRAPVALPSRPAD